MKMLFTDEILLHSLVLFLVLGSVAGLIAGVLLMWRPEWLLRASRVANSWVSTRQMVRPLEQPVDIDHWFYRHGKWAGLFIVCGALYVDYTFLVRMNRVELLSVLSAMHWVPAIWQETLLDTLVLLIITGAQLTLFVGMFLLFRPSMMRDFERGANQRISLRQSMKPLEIQHSGVDQFVFRNVLATSVLLLLGSLYSLVMLVLWLLK
jgi:hypothetical protein